MAPARKGFLFLECDGLTGRENDSTKQLKNRHAQLAASSQARGAKDVRRVPATAAPVQITFKAADESKPSETFIGRCLRCKKRRKIARLTNRCTQCSEHDPAAGQNTRTRQTIALPSSGHSHSPTALIEHDGVDHCPITCDISCGMQGCPADRKAMHYFLNFAALDLSGYLPGRFWDRFVLQASQSEPIVRQALLAVSNAHLDHCTTATTSPVSMASYQVAINKLRTYMNRKQEPSPELVLICCILLFTFDRLRGEYATAAVHLRSAMSILVNAQKTAKFEAGCCPLLGSKAEEQDSMHDLAVMLLQMDIEDTMPALDRGPLLPMMHESSSALWHDPPPMKFWTPHDFMESWMHICHGVWTFIGKNARYRHVPLSRIPDVTIRERAQFQLWVKTWRVAFKDLALRQPAPEISDIPSTPAEPALHRRIIDSINTLIIESHYYVIKGVLAECLGDQEERMPFDRCAEKMLRCGEKALALRQAYRAMHSLHIGKTFSTHVGIVESLLLLSHRTTSPQVRLRAQLLIRGFRKVTGELTGVTAFFAGYGAPPSDMILIYEKPGH